MRKVPFFTTPPEDGDGGGAEGAKAAEAVFVEGFGREFDVAAGDAEVCPGYLFTVDAVDVLNESLFRWNTAPVHAP